MKTEYIDTPTGKRRVKAIAEQINKSRGIAMSQCREIARTEVKEWAFKFSPEGLRN